jgi:predicted kinase
MEERLGRSRLIIVCGIPGSGKSTFAIRVADRWGAVKFASETFAEQLGAAARTASGDLTKEAITHAYSAMGAAVADALATNKLVIAVGSFRSEEQRSRFRANRFHDGDRSCEGWTCREPEETGRKRDRNRRAHFRVSKIALS